MSKADKNKITAFDAKKKHRFLGFYASCGRMNEAAKKANVNPSTVIGHRKADVAFGEAFKEAYQTYCESLEREVERRGKNGVLRPIFQRGVLVGHTTEYSDVLMLAHAKRHILEYRDKHLVDLHHSGGVLVVPGMSKDSHEWERGNNGDDEKG